jgi:hypothetical protein
LAYHNVLGGWPRSADGKSPGYYGRGPLYTTKDYEDCNSRFAKMPGFIPIRVDEVTQPKVTEMSLENGVSLILNYHDHVQFGPRRVGVGSGGKTLYAMHSGTTNEFREEAGWRLDPFWIAYYGQPQELKCLDSPTIDRLSVSEKGIWIETICAAWPDPLSNLRRLRPGVGRVLRRTDLDLG